MRKAAETILNKCMGVKKGERVLIITDKKKIDIGKALLRKAEEITEAKLIKIPIGKRNGEEPPKEVSKDMLNYDVILMPTTKSLSHTSARRKACAKGARIASMPGITEDIIKRTMTADYRKITHTSEKINKALKDSKKIRILTDIGTDITMKMAERHKFTDQGIYHKKRDWGNLPAGEAGGAPIEGSAEGIFIVDASFGGIGKVDKPIKIKVKDGFAVEIKGGRSAANLRKILKSVKDKRAYNIAELGIGTNYKAKITGNVLEDEKVMGTAHIALGNNSAYGGTVTVPVHLDGIFTKPTIFVDDKKIMDKGELV